jgi:hypothetical protein
MDQPSERELKHAIHADQTPERKIRATVDNLMMNATIESLKPSQELRPELRKDPDNQGTT